MTEVDPHNEATFKVCVIPSDVREQLERELSLIAELDYGGYFLTMKEIVEFCRRDQSRN